MVILNSVLSWIASHGPLILGALLALSEILAEIPGVKANSIFQLVVGFLTKKKAELPKL